MHVVPQSSSAPASSSLPVRRACESVRALLEAGDVRAAQQAIPLQCQEALKVQPNSIYCVQYVLVKNQHVSHDTAHSDSCLLAV